MHMQRADLLLHSTLWCEAMAFKHGAAAPAQLAVPLWFKPADRQ